MSTLTTAMVSSARTDLAAGESWIELVPAAHAEPHQVSFPAVVEPGRHHGLWVRPRLRRDVAEALCEWLNLVYPVDPDWYPLARFEGDLLVIFTGDAAHQRHEIARGEAGRYPRRDIGRWFLSEPTRTPGRRTREFMVLRDPSRHTPEPDETLVTCDPGPRPIRVFPARIDTRPGSDSSVIPTFRPEVAEAMALWCTTRHRADPGNHPQAYFDGDTLIHVHQHLRGLDGYLPWRIDPDPDGNYRIDGDEWRFQLRPVKSEGTGAVRQAAIARQGRRVRPGSLT